MGVEDARKLLLGARGIGGETADSILLYACRMPTLPVSRYFSKIASRLGLELRGYEEAGRAVPRSLECPARLKAKAEKLRRRIAVSSDGMRLSFSADYDEIRRTDITTALISPQFRADRDRPLSALVGSETTPLRSTPHFPHISLPLHSDPTLTL